MFVAARFTPMCSSSKLPASPRREERQPLYRSRNRVLMLEEAPVERHIEIVDLRDDGRVITIIEVLSRGNKVGLAGVRSIPLAAKNEAFTYSAPAIESSTSSRASMIAGNSRHA